MKDKGTKDQMEGHAKEVKGRIQQAVGDLTGDAELKAKGHKTEAQGKTQGFFGKVKDTVEEAVDIVKDKVEEVTHPDKTDTHK